MLGEYLRARRELIRPEDVGLPVYGVRRVAGLRREEVAMLAGISSDYYLRLEQGRDRNPSVQVLESLAGPRQLLDTLDLPAFVEGRYFDVLAANPLATALSPNLQVGYNRLHSVFLDPGEQALYPDWHQATVGIVAGLRTSVGSDVDDPRFVQLVGELSLASARFRQLWARHDVQALEGRPIALAHPQVGDLTLHREKLAIGGTDGQLLVIYHAEPGSSSADKLALLASLARPAVVLPREESEDPIR